jgi:sulfide:quinone oxidoreductase
VTGTPTPAGRPTRILIAGAGVAGVETALALHALCRDRVSVELLSPDDELRLRAMLPARALGAGGDAHYPLPLLAERAGTRLTQGELAAVDGGRRVAVTADGRKLEYDRLVIAVGARRERWLGDGPVYLSGPDDVPDLLELRRRIVRAAHRDLGTRLAVVVPPGPGWALPAYETALLLADHVERRGLRRWLAVDLVTSEDAALAAFGPEASAAVAEDLRAAGIRLWTATLVQGWSWGRLDLLPRGTLVTDRVIALPTLRGPCVGGVPRDGLGFVRADTCGRVPGLEGVYVVGDAGPFPLKQGGIGCQQGDAVAAAIARELGADVEPVPFEPALRALLLRGDRPRALRAALQGGRTESPGMTSDEERLWLPAAKVAGRYLAPALAGALGGTTLSDPPPG